MIKLKSKIVSEKSLFNKLKQVKEKKIIATNGCFDILHPGHVLFLREARKLGDVLIIALNDDESVRRIKGNERPINKLIYRQTMLQTLELANFITSYPEDTPEKFYRKLMPNMIVKGGDYEEREIVGKEIISEYGGKVKILPFISGFSSSEIINRIRNKKNK